MSSEVTLEEVWRLFKATDEKLDRVSAMMDRNSAEMARNSADVAKNSADIARTSADVARTSADVARTSADVARTSADVARITRGFEDLSSKWGRFVENMVAPACEKLFAARGIPVHVVSQRVRSRRDDRSMESDVVVENGDHVVLVEVKSTLKVEDVQDHLARLAEAKWFFPRFADRKILGAVAGMMIDEGADKFAYRQGLFVIAQAGDSVRLLNDGKFMPKAW